MVTVEKCHTVREIWQQPSTWPETASLMTAASAAVLASIENIGAIVLTGSGSSEYAGECVAASVQAECGVPVTSAGAGAILTDPLHILATGPELLVSIARSGDSPESHAIIDFALSRRPHTKHLIITCNRSGRIATAFQQDRRVRVIALDERTNDRSLVMTSSFTNLVVAARFLGMTASVNTYQHTVAALSRACEHLLEQHAEAIEKVARGSFQRALYLGTGARFGAARESALKMLEMTAGRVATMAETFLGLRHGPMSFIDQDTLVVCFVSSTQPARAYEIDLIHELNAKGLGSTKIIVGEGVPADVLGLGDYQIDCPASPIIFVVVGQLLALFRCIAEGLDPDAPSAKGVISRVVPPFRLHGLESGWR